MKTYLTYFILLLLVIALGLFSRQVSFIPLATGDALWAVAVYLTWRLFFPKWRVRWLFLLALCSSFLVEFSQLLDWKWLVALRQTRLGHLLLGQGFLLSDLLAYCLGLLAVAGLDKWFMEKKGY